MAELIFKTGTPTVPSREMRYFLIAGGEGKPIWGAWYLQDYPLHYEDGCPNKDREGFTCSCENGDGCETTGWFEETSNFDYDEFYKKLPQEPVAFAEQPTFKPFPAPKPTDVDLEAAGAILAKWLGYSWNGLSKDDISDRFPDWAFNGVGHKSLQGGRPAIRKVLGEILAVSKPPDQMMEAFKPTHQHRRTGGLYRVLTECCIEATEETGIVYDDASGQVWVRSAHVFNDGRFIALTSAEQSSPAKGEKL